MMLRAGVVLASRYRIEHPIARGGMGAVYEAFDVTLGRAVALKVLRDELVADPRALERFRREARACAAVTHPSLVALYDLQLEHEPPFLVMELVEGETLDAVLAERGRLPWPEVVTLGVQLLEGLARLHDVGVVHRDVKPSNVMMRDDGRAALLDLGVARIDAEKTLTDAGVSVGTPAYMAPEQLMGRGAGPALDLFAVGLVLHVAATGQHPSRGTACRGALRGAHAAREPRA
ncbi:MAG: serine/threonine protein kinase [Sandaracinus sp.]|nr:serine/threonine protein kinase [Sandaracinus sp.]